MAGSEGGKKSLDVAESEAGRYVRYGKLLRSSGNRNVFLGLDVKTGIELEWLKIVLTNDTFEEEIRKLCLEANLIKCAINENVIDFHRFWVNYGESRSINLLTERFNKGNLWAYLKSHVQLSCDGIAVKKWCRNILGALAFLHSNGVVHRNIRCENIFVYGDGSRVKLGEFSESILVDDEDIKDCYQSLEFMSRDKFIGQYNISGDIFSFGMCVLQMVTRELPYVECKGEIQLRTAILSRVRPAALKQMPVSDVKSFIEICLSDVPPSAQDLLHHPFLMATDPSSSTATNYVFNSATLQEVVRDQTYMFLPGKSIKLIAETIGNGDATLTCLIGHQTDHIDFSVDEDCVKTIIDNFASITKASNLEITVVKLLLIKLLRYMKRDDMPDYATLFQISNDGCDSFEVSSSFI